MVPLDISHFGRAYDEIGVVLVDHGSRRQESNQLLLQVVAAYRRHADWQIVEAAHMELAEPSLVTAFGRCTERGATLIIVFPYFLSPGRHWKSDIPDLCRQASEAHGGVQYLVTAPLGLHELMLQVIDQRIAGCLQHVSSTGPACDICAPAAGCRILPSSSASGR